MLSAGVGLSDLSNLVLIEGDVMFSLSSAAPQLDIGGRLGVPASGDRYVDGQVQAHYTVGQPNITGTAASVFRFPTNGAVVQLNSNQINFDVGRTSVRLNGSQMNGTLLRLFTITGGFAVNADPSNLGAMQGTLAATIDYGNNFPVRYPTDFNPDTVSGTTWYGFGVAANVVYHFNSSASFALANGDCSANFNATLDGIAHGKIRWSSWIGSDVKQFDAQMHCNGSLTKAVGSGDIKLTGTINLSVDTYSDSFSVTDKTIISTSSL